MRKREVIEIEKQGMTTTIDRAMFGLMIELILDIRDLLATNKDSK